MTIHELPEATFDDLFREIIEPGYCYACGGCSSICPVTVIEFQEEHPKFTGKWPTLVGECIDCGACLQACPSYWDRVHGENRDNKFIGTFHETEDKEPIMYLAYAKDPTVREAGQSGGVVTAILMAAKKEGKIEAAAILEEKKGYTNIGATAAKDEKAFVKGAGSKFVSYPSVEGILRLRHQWNPQGLRVFVGVPCMVKALNWMRLVKTDWLDEKSISIGLLCTTIFHPDKLREFLHGKGIDLDSDVQKVAVRSGVLRLTMRDGSREEMSVKEADEAASREGCSYCLDLSAETADLAVGELGVPDGTSFVMVRTQRGRDLLDTAVSTGTLILEHIPENTMKHVLRLNRYKKKRQPPPPLKPFPGPTWLPLRDNLQKEN